MISPVNVFQICVRVWRALCVVAALAWASGLSLGKDLAEEWKSGEIWKLPRGARSGIYMRDSDASRSIAGGGVSFGAVPLGEVTFEWREVEQADAGDAGKAAEPPRALYRITCMVYNRGDDGDISGKEFEERIKSVTNALSDFFGKKPKKPPIPANRNTLKTNILQWKDGTGVLNLESATSGPKEKGGIPEFIRLVMSADKHDVVKGNSVDKIGLVSLRKSLATDDDGTVWIQGIPMIDQGAKGYCVPATVSRVFAYYGMDSVGMHELASLAGSAAEGGTSPLKMEAALQKIGTRYRVRYKALPKPTGAHADYYKEYNNEANAAGKPRIEDNSSKWYENLDGALWAAVRAKKGTDVNKWFTPIRRNIDRGIPVIWSVFASGLNSREMSQGAGGPHMRLIIGYNAKANTIVYSDSWGKWATRRVMTIPEAYSITSRTYVLLP